MNKLMLGSGRGSQRAMNEGWITVDGFPAYKATHVAVVPPLPEEVKQQAWDVIQTIHFLEHLWEWQAIELHEEIYEVLTPGGKLIHELPNLHITTGVVHGAIDVSGKKQPDFLGIYGIFGEQRKGEPLYSHRFGYTPQSLTDQLVKCGFERHNIEVLPATRHRPFRDFRIEATK